MSEGVKKLFEDGEFLVDRKQYAAAINVWDTARRLTKIPQRKGLASFDIGTVLWRSFGDGEAARGEFLTAISEFEKNGHISLESNEDFKVPYASALENAMLCALSFEEFESLSARLHELNADLPILVGLVPEFRNRRDSGRSWSDEMFEIAGSYYDRADPRNDKGRLGEARATYQLMLANRGALRLRRSHWRYALYEFGVLSIRMSLDLERAERAGDPGQRTLILRHLGSAMAEIDRYLLLNSADDLMMRVRKEMSDVVNHIGESAPPPPKKIKANWMSTETRIQICNKCHYVFSRMDIDGPQFLMGEQMLINKTTMCPKCGGDVSWKSMKNLGIASKGALPPLWLICAIAVGAMLVWILSTYFPMSGGAQP